MVKVQNREYFFGLLKFQMFFGVLEITDIFFWGVNGRCWARAYVCRKNRVSAPGGTSPSKNGKLTISKSKSSRLL